MSRIESCFEQLQTVGKKALVAYITAGDPHPEMTVPLLHALAEAGADIIELGVPFSDPMADGPVIQKACERALRHHVSLRDVLDMVKVFRQTNQTTPIVLMGYLNPIEVMGYAEFAGQAHAAGVDGVLTVDMPPEEAGDVLDIYAREGLDPIFLVSPESTVERFRIISGYSKGFLYYVSLKGVTGVKAIDTDAVAGKMAELRAFTDLPVGVGFGINNAETARAVAGIADAVVIGSAIVRRIEENQGDSQRLLSEVSGFTKTIRQAIDSI